MPSVRKPERSGRHPRVSLALTLALAATLGISGGAGADPAKAAKARAGISYKAISSSLLEPLCVGESETYEVGINRITLVNGQRYRQWVTGGYVLGVISNEAVGRFEPRDAGRDVIGGAPVPVATFEFIAKSPGRTTIEFHVIRTGEEARVGADFSRTSDTVEVEVVDCFEAYTSGLATTFTAKDMEDLTEPFFLEGRIASSTVAGTTQFMFFAPNPQNRTTGGYAFIDTAWPLAGPQGRCTAYISGRYDVVFYGHPDRPVEGDLMMRGSGVLVCANSSVEIDYTNAPGFQIGFRPSGAP